MDDPLLQGRSQELSMSSKYPHKGPSILDTLVIQIWTQKFLGIFLWVNNVIHDIKDDPVLQVSGLEPSKSFKYPHDMIFMFLHLF